MVAYLAAPRDLSIRPRRPLRIIEQPLHRTPAALDAGRPATRMPAARHRRRHHGDDNDTT
jgi:hypothetical protein